jgi:hypothetical protein
VIGDNGPDVTAGTELEAGDFDAGLDGDAFSFGFVGNTEHSGRIEGKTAAVFVEEGGQSSGPPIGEDLTHVIKDFLLALDQG